MVRFSRFLTGHGKKGRVTISMGEIHIHQKRLFEMG